MQSYKDAIQAIFEDMVFSQYGHDRYWELPTADQDVLFAQAERLYADRMADRADYLRKKECEG